MIKKFILTFAILIEVVSVYGQNFPWERPLRMAWSNDGKTFGNTEIYQDSSGVPSVIRWKGDTLICAFQWFRKPNPSPSWDRVAVKFSYDGGNSWTEPTPIVINGLPNNYQRPFDPTLVTIENDSIRIYFSSSVGFPVGGLDATVNTYSARSRDGIHYTFEPNARVDESMAQVIDPAVIFFKSTYHYLAPIGSPQQGAYHYISQNGINFSKVPDITSDNNHNWTGNYMVNSPEELRFYGGGSQGIWFKSSPNGGMWGSYVNTNIHGGDPSVVKTENGKYLMIFVGEPYATNGLDLVENSGVVIYPNPATNVIYVKANQNQNGSAYALYSLDGNLILSGNLNNEIAAIDVEQLPVGIFIVKLKLKEGGINTFKVVKE